MSIKDVNLIGERLKAYGYQSWLVGGAVRDLLLDEAVKDYDIATTALPQEVLKIFPDAVPTGERFGTVTVIIGGKGYEVTTLRKERLYVGHHPQLIQFTDRLVDDLARRDFTINAMAVELPMDESDIESQVIDEFGGKAHLRNRIIATVGIPDERFKEDPLRMMRAIRLTTDLNFFIEHTTREAIRRLSGLMSTVSVERIRQEFERILLPRRGVPSKGLMLLENTNLLSYVSPYLEATVGVLQDPRWHMYDVWDHTRQVVDRVQPTLRQRLAALFHDVGKPFTQSIDADGDIHFYGHQELSAKFALEELKRLTFPTRLAEQVATLCREHMFSHETGPKGIRKLYMRLSNDLGTAGGLFEDLLSLRRADIIGSGIQSRIDFELAEHERFVARAKEAIGPLKEANAGFKLAVTGHDIMNLLGIKPGRQVGEIKQELVDWVLGDPSRNTREALLERIQQIASR